MKPSKELQAKVDKLNAAGIPTWSQKDGAVVAKMLTNKGWNKIGARRVILTAIIRVKGVPTSELVHPLRKHLKGLAGVEMEERVAKNKANLAIPIKDRRLDRWAMVSSYWIPNNDGVKQLVTYMTNAQGTTTVWVEMNRTSNRYKS